MAADSRLASFLMRRASFLAANLASSFALALMARASARRVARLLRRLNRPIPAASRSISRDPAIVAALVGLTLSPHRQCGGPDPGRTTVFRPPANSAAVLCDNLLDD